MEEYCKRKIMGRSLRLPLNGHLDVTYRCNNRCRHCWISLPLDHESQKDELSFAEIRRIVDEARGLGCRHWYFSGGEPMVRDDFAEIFDFITQKCVNYTLNTNGTLITQGIARLLRRRGVKLVAIYGADAGVHDHITRNPGSFDAVMQGIAYLREAGARFTVQLVPVKDNYHQWGQMVRLAEQRSPLWRVGADWLYLSANGNPERNREIRRQRLAPETIASLDPPVPASPSSDFVACGRNEYAKGLSFECIRDGLGFHINPYGKFSFCVFAVDSNLRYDLRSGSVADAWDRFLPELASRRYDNEPYERHCGACSMRSDCRWCPAFAYLEHRSYTAPVSYLCDLCSEDRRYRERWQNEHNRYFSVGGMTIRLSSDLPFRSDTLQEKFRFFEVGPMAKFDISVHHHFSLPKVGRLRPEDEVYRKPPWAVYRTKERWIYLGISEDIDGGRIHQVVEVSDDDRHVRIFSDGEDGFHQGHWENITRMPTDQILFSRILADLNGCILHAGGMIRNGKGILFAGHSGAGKTTILRMFQEEADIISDDRIMIRKPENRFHIYGTWHHGELPTVSPASAPLKAVLFIEQGKENRLVPIENPMEAHNKILACLIKPLVTRKWWEKTLETTEKLIREIPCHRLIFDRTGDVRDLVFDLIGAEQ